MFVIIHAITMTVDDIEVSAKFYHAVSPITDLRVHLAFIGKQMAVHSRKNKVNRVGKFRYPRRSPRLNWRQSFRAISLNNIQPGQQSIQPSNPSLPSGATSVAAPGNVPAIEQPSLTVVQPALSANKIIQPVTTSDYNLVGETILSSAATVQQAAAWLQTNRFSAFIRTFANFSGLDLLRLSCDNLVQICGLPEGIRLFNALHKASRLTLYLCIEANPDVYHAIYLAALTNQELKMKVATMLGLQSSQIDELFLRGPNGIHIIISDDVVHNFKDESTFLIEIIQGNADAYSLLLKPAANGVGPKCPNNS